MWLSAIAVAARKMHHVVIQLQLVHIHFGSAGLLKEHLTAQDKGAGDHQDHADGVVPLQSLAEDEVVCYRHEERVEGPENCDDSGVDFHETGHPDGYECQQLYRQVNDTEYC